MPTIINLENIENDLGAQINNSIEYINKGCTLCGGDGHKIEECNILTNIKHIHDKKIPTRARLTLPSELRVETMSDGTCNVVAQVPLPKGTRFGPFEGKKIQILHPLITFPIKLFKIDENDIEYYFDPSNEEIGNWMCFVAAANDILEQNLICYQMKNNIYYSAIRDIKVGEYLKVWYAAYYAEKMGTAVLKRVESDPQNYADDIKVEKLVNQKVAETLPAENLGATTDTSIWVCRFCKTTIKNIVLFSTHLQQHYKDLAAKTFTCAICYKHCLSEKALLSHQITIHNLNVAQHKLPLIQKQNEITTSIVDTTSSSSSTNNNSIQHFINNKKDDTTVVEATTTTVSTPTPTSTNQQLDANNIFTKINVYDTDLDFSTKTIVNDSLVGGQTQDQIDQNTSLLDQSTNALLVDNITLNYNHHDLNNVMLTKISELNEHLKFDIKDTTVSGSDLNDSLNTDSLHDILCEDDSKASKIAQEKSIADFSLDFVESNGLNLNTPSTLSTNDTNTTDTNSNTNIPTNQDLPPPESGPPYYCDICRKEFQNIEYLIRHLKKHSGEFTCIDCFAVFGRRENFLNHSCKWDSKKKNTFECMYCSKVFSEQKYLNRHVQRHNKQRKTCPKCGTVFENESDLEHHVCDTTKPIVEKKFECDICKNRYIKNSYLRGHILKCHKKPAEQAAAAAANKTLTDNNSTTATDSSSSSSTSQCICYMCGESFSNAATLKSHLLIHQPKKYGCDVCDKKFHRSETCEQHKLTHTNATFDCKTCSKMFKSQKSLKKHQLIHNDASECHKCEFCNRIFIQKHNLEKHINFQHSVDQPKFPCDLCTNVFTSANNLKDHKATHNLTDSLNSSKQLSCEYCKKNFTKTNLLKAHYVTTHLNRMFSCPYCTTIVKHRASIRRHLSKSHREKRGEWDNSDFIGKLVSQNKKPPDELEHDNSTTSTIDMNTSTQHLVPIEPVTSSTMNLTDNLTNNSTTNTNDSTILLQNSSTDNEMDTNDINQNHTLIVEQQQQQQDQHMVQQNQQQQHLLPKMYNTMSQVVDSTHQLFTTTNNDQLEFQNIIYLKNNHDVDLDLEKITEYSNLDSATAKLSQFSDLSSTSSQIQVTSHNSHQLHQSNNTDNLPKFTRIDRSNDFDMMDIQSLISTDSGMIEFPNELVERTDTTPQFTNNMNLQLHNVNLHGNSNFLHMTDEDREVTLGKNAFILDDGTIVEPQEAGNLMFYVLNQS